MYGRVCGSEPDHDQRRARALSGVTATTWSPGLAASRAVSWALCGGICGGEAACSRTATMRRAAYADS